MTTSPAFGLRTKADEKTGDANDPDVRPEIEATRPTGMKKPTDKPAAVP